jgi:hypothetical protein
MKSMSPSNSVVTVPMNAPDLQIGGAAHRFVKDHPASHTVERVIGVEPEFPGRRVVNHGDVVPRAIVRALVPREKIIVWRPPAACRRRRRDPPPILALAVARPVLARMAADVVVVLSVRTSASKVKDPVKFRLPDGSGTITRPGHPRTAAPGCFRN